MKKLFKTVGILFGWLALLWEIFAGSHGIHIMKYEWTAFPAMVAGVMLLVCGLLVSVYLAEKIWEQKDVRSGLLGPWGFRKKVKM
jgi:hypothetical protein